MRWAACYGIFTLVLVLAVLGIQLRLHSVTIQTCYTYFSTTLTHEMITLDSFGWSISCVWRINGVYILYAQAFAVDFNPSEETIDLFLARSPLNTEGSLTLILFKAHR
jgi:hypothetical protein